jgi:hypothetical protein
VDLFNYFSTVNLVRALSLVINKNFFFHFKVPITFPSVNMSYLVLHRKLHQIGVSFEIGTTLKLSPTLEKEKRQNMLEKSDEELSKKDKHGGRHNYITRMLAICYLQPIPLSMMEGDYK